MTTHIDTLKEGIPEDIHHISIAYNDSKPSKENKSNTNENNQNTNDSTMELDNEIMDLSVYANNTNSNNELNNDNDSSHDSDFDPANVPTVGDPNANDIQECVNDIHESKDSSGENDIHEFEEKQEEISHAAITDTGENANVDDENIREPMYECYMPMPIDGMCDKDIIAKALGTKSNPIQYPELKDPLNEFDTPYLMTAVWPTLFANGGLGDPTGQNRDTPVDLVMGIRHLLEYAEERSDGSYYYRFASHPMFVFWCHDMLRRHSGLKQSSFVCNTEITDEDLRYMSIDDMQKALDEGSKKTLLKKL